MRCGWVVKENVCGMACLSLSSLNIHLSEHLDELTVSTTQGQACPWYKCQFRFDSLDFLQLKLHTYFHAFLQSLNVAGSKYIKDKNLPICRLPVSGVSSAMPNLLQPYTCQWISGKCKQEFHLPADFYLHVWEHGSYACATEGGRQLECEWEGCTYRINKKSSLQTHLRMHTQEKVVACPTCSTVFATNPSLEDHLHRQAPRSSLYACDICRKQFSTERLLKAHLNKHINNKQCSLCGFTMLDASHLKRHMLFKHSDERAEVCAHCNKSYKSKDVLERHIVLSHSLPESAFSAAHSEKSYLCHLCERKYSNSSYLGRHLSREHNLRSELLHPKLRRFKFVRCEDGFYRVAHSSQLHHLSPVKPLSYRCHVCHLRFFQGKLLSRHLTRTHGFSLPKGYSRFRYLKNSEGFHELVMFRIESKMLHSEN